jgi:hypothetical protein
MVAPGLEPVISGSVARNFDHIFEVSYTWDISAPLKLSMKLNSALFVFLSHRTTPLRGTPVCPYFFFFSSYSLIKCGVYMSGRSQTESEDSDVRYVRIIVKGAKY